MKAPWTTGPVGAAAPWDRWDRRALLVAGAITAWVFVAKLKAFLDLCFTSDLFIQTQLARSWLEGRFLEDNCYGRHLAIHTYFFLPVLGLLAKPLGAPGLLLALALAVGASALLAHRILRLFGIDGPNALAAAVALVSLPTSIWVFGDALGFHVDLMLPPLALGLFYALLRRRFVAALIMTAARLQREGRRADHRSDRRRRRRRRSAHRRPPLAPAGARESRPRRRAAAGADGDQGQPGPGAILGQPHRAAGGVDRGRGGGGEGAARLRRGRRLVVAGVLAAPRAGRSCSWRRRSGRSCCAPGWRRSAS